MSRLTQEEFDALPPKTKKHENVNRLYLEHDYLTAYALHMDWRVEQEPKGAVGALSDWERHGDIQAQFLKDMGLQPQHRLLDIGCGTGRLARKIVPYLNPERYMGVDLSPKAIKYCIKLAEDEGWAQYSPAFIVSDHLDIVGSYDYLPFDYIWAFSIFIHTPADIMRKVMVLAAGSMEVESQFYFSYVPEKVEGRTGLKQWRHRLETYQEAVYAAGMTFREVKEWGAEQKVALAMLERTDAGD